MSRQIEYLSDYEEEANLRRSTFGRTDKHLTGFGGLDEYLGAGYGNRHGYEIITVFGESGVGKSSFVLNMVAHEMLLGTKVGLMILEDDMPDVYNRLQAIVEERGMLHLKRHKNVEVLPNEMLEKGWNAEVILQWMRDKHADRGIELFVLDHINFVFDNEENGKNEDRLTQQRRFMLALNLLVKKLKLTVIIVSHTAKAEAGGMNRIYGTTAIKQISTKVIGVDIAEGGDLVITMYKSRFTRRAEGIYQMQRIGLKLQEHTNGQLPLQPKPDTKRPRKHRAPGEEER